LQPQHSALRRKLTSVAPTGARENGFGSALLEAAKAAGLDTRNVVRAGIPDRFYPLFLYRRVKVTQCQRGSPSTWM
jgi:hypothetical protein